MMASPVFIGAEPNVCLSQPDHLLLANADTVKKVIDSGPDIGVRILDAAGDVPLELVQSLQHDLQQKVQIFKKMKDEDMSDDRWNPADQVKPLYH